MKSQERLGKEGEINVINRKRSRKRVESQHQHGLPPG